MATSVHDGLRVAWWQEPTREQWHAWIAAWLGWTLDAFDFTIFLFIMLPIAQEFHVPLTAVTAVFTVTLWMRLVGATGVGLARRSDRTQKAADDLDRLVSPPATSSPASPPASRSCSCSARCWASAWARNGRWRLAGDGKLADPLARLHGGGDARVVGPGRPAVERGLWPAL